MRSKHWKRKREFIDFDGGMCDKYVQRNFLIWDYIRMTGWVNFVTISWECGGGGWVLLRIQIKDVLSSSLTVRVTWKLEESTEMTSLQPHLESACGNFMFWQRYACVGRRFFFWVSRISNPENKRKWQYVRSWTRESRAFLIKVALDTHKHCLRVFSGPSHCATCHYSFSR